MLLIDVPVGMMVGQVIAGAGRNMLRSDILVIVYFSREATFNIAVTRADYRAGEVFSFFNNPFFIYRLVLTVLFCGLLPACYPWVRKRDKEV